MDIDCNLAFVDVLWVVVDHDALSDSELSTEHVGSQNFLFRILPGHPDDVEQFILDYAEGHQLPDPLLFSCDQLPSGHATPWVLV